MSDFSSIEVSQEFALLPSGARKDHRFQTKDLPEDGEYVACVDGVIESDGLFVRKDVRGRYWNPSLSSWVRLLGQFTGFKFICRFENGRVVEVREDAGMWTHIRPDMRGDWSPANWHEL